MKIYFHALPAVFAIIGLNGSSLAVILNIGFSPPSRTSQVYKHLLSAVFILACSLTEMKPIG